MLYKKTKKKDRIILLQGENGRKFIENNLRQAGFQICLIECYKRVSKIFNNEKETQKWQSYHIDTLLVTSSEILYQLTHIVSNNIEQRKWLFKCKIFVVGQRLFQIAKELGWRDVVMSHYANNKCFVKTIKKFI